jgi:adenylate kinase family enzyme
VPYDKNGREMELLKAMKEMMNEIKDKIKEGMNVNRKAEVRRSKGNYAGQRAKGGNKSKGIKRRHKNKPSQDGNKS